MIVDALMDLFEAVVFFVASLLPEWTPDFLTNWGLVTNNLAAINYYVPLAELFGFVLGVFYLLPVLLLASLSLWLASFIRGGSSRA